MPPLPTEPARPLYEILPEVKVQAASTSADIYAPGHSYALPSAAPVNISKPDTTAAAEVKITKPVDITKGSGTSGEGAAGENKEDLKKKQEKKDKYKVKF